MYNEEAELAPPYKAYIETVFRALRWKFRHNLDLRPGTWCSNKIWDSVWLPFLDENRPVEIDEDTYETYEHKKDEDSGKACPYESGDGYNESEDDSRHKNDWDPTDEYPD